MGTSVESTSRTTAAFFDLDKTIIARSSTLAFAPSFYRHGLITRAQVRRGAVAQITFRLAGASHGRMERIRDQVSALCCGWPADMVAQIVTDGLGRTDRALRRVARARGWPELTFRRTGITDGPERATGTITHRDAVA